MAGKSQVLDMTGRRFGFLTVLRREGNYRNTTQAAWMCHCDCGVEKVMGGDNLRRGLVKSCGCRRGGHHVTHGHAKTPIYARWHGMHSRCYNPNNKSYPRYGGRGIRVCERWHTFENFLADMGLPPESKSLDRIDSNGPYAPDNCRWATAKEQSNNTRRNVTIETSSGRVSLAEAAKLAGISKNGLQYRRQKGLSDDKLLTEAHQGRQLSTI